MAQGVAANPFSTLPPSVIAHMASFEPTCRLFETNKFFEKPVETSMTLVGREIVGFNKEQLVAACTPVVNRIKAEFAQIPAPVEVDGEDFEKWTRVQTVLTRAENLAAHDDPLAVLHALHVVRGRLVSQREEQAEDPLGVELFSVIDLSARRQLLAGRARALGEGDFTPARFRALHEAQQHAVNALMGAHSATDVDDFRLPAGDGTYSLQRFLAAETRINEIRVQMGGNLVRMWEGNGDAWSGLRNELLALGLLAGANPQTAQEIEAWMEGHQPVLDQIEFLELRGSNLTAVPPALWERLSNLRGLDIGENPIPILPEPLYNRFYSYVYAFYFGVPHLGLKMTEENFREVPFTAWMSGFGIRTPFYFCTMAMWSCIHSCIQCLGLQQLWQAIILMIAVFILTLPFMLLAGLLSLPIYFYNALLHFLLLPLASFCRYLLDFSPMVSINQVAEELEA